MALKTYESLQGRITRTPELARHGDKWLLKFGVAQNHADNTADFIEARMWFEPRTDADGHTHPRTDAAVRVADSLRNGDDVVMSGALRTRTFTDEGVEVEVTEFNVYAVAPGMSKHRMAELVTITRIDPGTSRITAEQLTTPAPYATPSTSPSLHQ